MVEAKPENPSLPGYLLAIDAERRTFRLHYLVWFRRVSRAWSEGRMILAGGRRVDLLPIKLALLMVDALVRSRG